MMLRLFSDLTLPPGTAALPPSLAGGELRSLRLGLLSVEADGWVEAPDDQVRLAQDLWNGLSVPREGIRLQVRIDRSGAIELGPTLGVIYPGSCQDPSRAEARAAQLLEHLQDRPGLFVVGFERGIDWEKGLLNGFVLENGQEGKGRLVSACCPLPSVLRLVPGILPETRQRLRESTEHRAFNSVRRIDRWRRHTLLWADAAVRPHLPEARRLRSPVDLAAMLARHRAVLVTSPGQEPVKVSRRTGGIGLTAGTHQQEDLTMDGAVAAIRQLTGGRRAVLEQPVDLQGPDGKLRWVRILVVRQGDGRWRPAHHRLFVAEPGQSGARAEPGGTVAALMRFCGLNRKRSRRCLGRMERLALAAAHTLGEALPPVAILGVDIGLEPGNRRLWLLSATAAPRWPAGRETAGRIARSLVAYGLSLAGFSGEGVESPERRPIQA